MATPLKLPTLALILAACLTIKGCASTKFNIENPYTPQSTYNKLISTYPNLRIANTQVPSTLKEIKNVNYVCYKQNRCLALDLYRPKSRTAKLLPAIIFVHGGGWKDGERANMKALAIALTKRGFVTATVSYRLSGEALYPAAIHDVKAAVRWLREHASHYHVDPQKIVIAGGSAGGQIAALVGVTNNDVQAIVNIDGLSDFTLPAALQHENDPRKNPSSAGAWFGGRYEDVPERWQEASPVYYVNASTPPTLFITSSVPRFSLGYVEMTEKLNAFHIPNKVVNLPGSPHSFWFFEEWLPPTIIEIENFLDLVFLR